MKINISVVLYKTPIQDLNNLIDSFDIVESEFTLYLIDNSPTDVINKSINFKGDLVYIHNPENPGFGSSHNLAMNISIKDNIKYHFIVNPDVYFKSDVITNMVNYMEENPDVGMLMPKILNLDGTVQFLPKLLPSPYSLLMRKFKFPKSIYKKFINKYELREVDENLVYNAPVLSGCFTLLNTEALREVGLYDDRFFMYFEDWDLSRRINLKFKTVYYPNVSIYHGYDSGANKSKKLFKVYLKSASIYFNKWGWIFDKERKRVNKKTLKQFSNYN